MERQGDRVEFSQPIRQIFMMLTVLILVSAGLVLLGAQIRTVFLANPWLNGFIGGVFVIGVLATFWQVAQLISATNWLRNLQAGLKGHDIARPPRLIASMAPLLREGRISRRLAASTTRSILDSIAVRLDEARDITRYIANLLIFLGLLGTFWGLSQTVPAVVDTIRSLAPDEGDVSDASVFDRLMIGLEDQLIFPEVDYTQVDRTRGMNVTICTSAENDDDARALLLEHCDAKTAYHQRHNNAHHDRYPQQAPLLG